MVYVTMEATMLICPAERFLYVLYWLQKLLFFLIFFFFKIAKISSGELCSSSVGYFNSQLWHKNTLPETG